MGFKFNDILVKDHDHKKILNYFFKENFEEILEYKAEKFKWQQKHFLWPDF